MSYVNGLGAIRAYGASRVTEEALVARNTQSTEEQVRIAENSSDRLTLLNLALNKELSEEAVKALYDRDLDYVSSRLEKLGYEKKNFLGF